MLPSFNRFLLFLCQNVHWLIPNYKIKLVGEGQSLEFKNKRELYKTNLDNYLTEIVVDFLNMLKWLFGHLFWHLYKTYNNLLLQK